MRGSHRSTSTNYTRIQLWLNNPGQLQPFLSKPRKQQKFYRLSFQDLCVPLKVHSDNGKEFVIKLWAGLMKRMRVMKTLAYNPQSNTVERFHRTLNLII